MPLLTTITPYWNRPLQLEQWIRTIELVTIPEVHHLLYVIGNEPIPSFEAGNIEVIRLNEIPRSIGHYHNDGAVYAETPWIMKLDLDAAPNVMYFKELIQLLHRAEPREWFNGGMLMLNQRVSFGLDMLSAQAYQHVMSNRVSYVQGTNVSPVASNFICRRDEYLRLGGCDARFQGYGWEDYQQLYMLEHHYLGRDPLPGPISDANVTSRCREELSRRKAKELLLKSPWLCLLHRWHPVSTDNLYRAHMHSNRRVLLDYIQTTRHNDTRRSIHSQVHPSQSPSKANC